MITPFWPDQSWFQEIMNLAKIPQEGSDHHSCSYRMLPPRRQFQRSERTSSWLLTGPYNHLCPEWHWRGNFQESYRQEIPSRTTRRYLNSGVLSAMKEGYQSLKFVWAFWWSNWTTSKWFMTRYTQLCLCMPVPSVAYSNLHSKQWLQCP